MNSFLSFYSSSIGKKILMSLTGVFLMVFLVEHLVGNLYLFANDGGVKYQAYTEFLVSNPVIRFIEIFLFLFLVLHAALGAILWFQNRSIRPVKYKNFRLKDNTPLASRTTIWTGSVVFIFLVIHLKSFFVPSRFGNGELSLYELVVRAFENPWYDGFYLIALFLLGYHLKHGFQSAFQTLGLRGKTYTPFLDVVSFIFWFLIPLGFAAMPVYFYFYQPALSSASMGVH